MTREMARDRLESLVVFGGTLRAALADLFSQEFAYSSGHLATILNTCLFAPSLLTFWFVNGLVDFSTAVAIGAVATPAGLQVRLLAYLLLVPTFLLILPAITSWNISTPRGVENLHVIIAGSITRVTVHLLHPVHRTQILAGSCPSTRVMSLDWFSMGILATGIPLAVQNFGPWFGMNATFLVGIFVAPRLLPTRRVGVVKLLAIVAGGVVFLYANYGDAVPLLVAPSSILGPVATFALGDATTEWLFRLVNSIVFGPLLVGVFGVVMNHLLTRPELADIPYLRHALPRRDPDLVVVTNAALGTAFYLGVVAAATGRLVILP
jgi:hypothetical protein